MKKKYWLFIIGIIIIFFISSIIIFLNKGKQTDDKKNDVNSNVSTENSISDSIDEKKIESIKQDLGYNNTYSEIYEIKTEYDGREVISVKPNIQYNVAMAGIIKNEKPEFSEINNLLKKAPNKSGIWIEKNSQKKFLSIINSISNIQYTIDDDGYLKEKQTNNLNELDKIIKKAMSNKKKYSISINSIAYLIDEVTGNIEEYPFEEIDPEQPYELFETENAALYIINSNTNKKMNEKDLINEVLNSISN